MLVVQLPPLQSKVKKHWKSPCPCSWATGGQIFICSRFSNYFSRAFFFACVQKKRISPLLFFELFDRWLAAVACTAKISEPTKLLTMFLASKSVDRRFWSALKTGRFWGSEEWNVRSGCTYVCRYIAQQKFAISHCLKSWEVRPSAMAKATLFFFASWATRPTLSQFWSLKISRSAFLDFIEFAEILIERP